MSQPLSWIAPRLDLPRAFTEWLKAFAWAKTRRGWRPFTVTRGQWLAVRSLGFFALKRGWWAAVKARQVGFTTLLLMWSIWYCLAHPGKCVLWVAPSADVGAEVLQAFRAVVEWHRQHVPGLSDGLVIDNQMQSVFANGSRIKWAVIGGTEGTADMVARCATCDVAVMTEAAYPTDPELFGLALHALGPALERRQAPIMFDSTPNGDSGRGGPYHDLVRDLEAGRREGGVFTFPWFLEPDYADPCDEGEVMGSLSPEEAALVEEFGLSARQIAWRRRMTATADQRSRFKEKYVERLGEAFLVRGDDNPVPAELLRAATAAHGRGEGRALSALDLVRAGAPVLARLQDDPLLWEMNVKRGGVQVWMVPQAAGRVWAAADCSDGLPGSDWQALALVSETGRLAALAYVRVDPLRFAALTQRLCEWYGVERLVVESQKSEPTYGALRKGLRVEGVRGAAPGELDVLARPYEGRCEKQHTSEAVHDEAMDHALRLLSSVEEAAKSSALLTELADLRRVRGTLKAREGGHDDALMGLGLAERARRRDLQREADRRSRRGGGDGRGSAGRRGGRGDFRAAPAKGRGRYGYLK
jgi:hypothetical protein